MVRAIQLVLHTAGIGDTIGSVHVRDQGTDITPDPGRNVAEQQQPPEADPRQGWNGAVPQIPVDQDSVARLKIELYLPVLVTLIAQRNPYPGIRV